jgi:hypothetical protein
LLPDTGPTMSTPWWLAELNRWLILQPKGHGITMAD